MKKSKKKFLTLMLAGALCGTALMGAAMLDGSVSASAADVNYSLTDVFASNNAQAVIGSAKQNAGDEKETTTFSLKSDDYVRIKRDLAFKWYEGKEDAGYLTLKFSFKDLNFTSVSFAIESESSIATEAEKAVNVVKFTKSGDVVSVAVIADGTEEKDATSHVTTITAGSEITLALFEDGSEAFDEFSVTLNGDTIGKFMHVGANFGEYDSSSTDSDPVMYPLQITAESKEATVLYLDEINNQRFDNVTVTDKVAKVADTACPVLVVNEDVNGFLLGTAFSLDYEKIDVLQNASLSETKRYYQYNPTKDYPAINNMKAFTTSTYFMDTVYELEDGTPTSIYQEEGREYVSLKIILGDNAYDKGAESGSEYARKVYDLSWYALENNTAENEVVVTKTEKDGKTQTDYIVLNRNEDGPAYNYITAVETDKDNRTGENQVNAALSNQVDAYNTLLKTAAADVYAGSNAYIYLPSMEWLIGDNNGYRSLKFSISYKNASNTQTTTSLSYNGLKIAASSEGTYEFKILATDKAGNAMKYYDEEGKLVDVTTSNIWDIEEIPYFTYTIKNQGMKVKNEESDKASERTATAVVDDVYSLSGITIVGGTNQKTEYALYKVDTSKYAKLSQSALSAVTYKDIREGLAPKLPLVEKDYNGDYFAMYLDVYAGLIATELNGNADDKDAIKKCFTRIEKYNDKITEDDAEWEKYNKYEWQNSNDYSFKTAEEGEYVMFVDYYDSLLPTVSRTAAYKLIVVDSEVDVIEGESDWLANNLISVILFSVAAVMLILIIILLLVKPSDETLEDVDKKAALTSRAARTKGVKKDKK